MFPRHPLLHPNPHGLVTRSMATAAGLDDADLRRLVKHGQLVRLRRGVFVHADQWAALDDFRGRPLLRIRAAQECLRSDHVLSHDSAAIVLGLGGPDARTALVHVTRPKVHGDQVITQDGMRVLDRARTALDMAREHGLVAGVACCDAALRLGARREELAAARSAMRCWPGSRVMDAALRLADPGAESWLESEARVLVTSLGIGRPETQFGLSDGNRTVWCDIRIGRHMFEADGYLKYTAANALGEDPDTVLWNEKERQDFILGFKLGVSRITAFDCRGGAQAAHRRLLREYADTCNRFGTDISDLAPYIVRRVRR